MRERCAFVLVCGDVFESNQVEREIVIRALEAMGETPQITFYLLPGNHDPLDAVSVYRSPTFAGKAPKNVVVLEGPDPVEAVSGVEVIAAPWLSTDPRTDLVNAACDRPGSRPLAQTGHSDCFIGFQRKPPSSYRHLSDDRLRRTRPSSERRVLWRGPEVSMRIRSTLAYSD